MTVEKPSWGFTRLQDVLKNLGIKTSRGTNTNNLKERGTDLAYRTSWMTRVKAYLEALAVSDLLTKETWTLRASVTYYLFFVIELNTRRA